MERAAADGSHYLTLSAPFWAQRAFARRVWLEASPRERAAITRESLSQGGPYEAALRREETRLRASLGLGEPVCVGCGDALPVFSRRDMRAALSARREAEDGLAEGEHRLAIEERELEAGGLDGRYFSAGDQTGWLSRPAPRVSFRCPLPSAFMT